MNSKTGVLHVVATPIGNLGDLSSRARETLQQADLVLAEDTRRTGVLMRHFNLGTPLSSFHDHNERQQVPEVLRRLSAGENIALVSDAGTPLISDPGYTLVSAAREQGFTVSPVPGPCALVAALSASGLPVDRFVFEGFVPARKGARQALLDRVAVEERTVVLYESSHRILETLEDMSSVLGPDRAVVIGREISKRFETFYRGDAVDVLEQLRAGTEHQYGEFVVMVEGAPAQDADEAMLRKLLQLLLDELPVKTASRIAAAWSGAGRNRVYALALDLGKNNDPDSE
ncbi:MAG: 16S rRNA (cytidine(1402)-2'-O)-methyltransferase [Gammaproteobacteria bacterium]|nr:16S rRNA (cytidine(1402)-2'-O)-methyltransferase [Gammaproteobacteria bacterium]MYG66506.1 16S rRNA (cytidine(1402)-2'-O)-methyltransferase [Gammaproteobacteria bacterium]